MGTPKGPKVKLEQYWDTNQVRTSYVMSAAKVRNDAATLIDTAVIEFRRHTLPTLASRGRVVQIPEGIGNKRLILIRCIEATDRSGDDVYYYVTLNKEWIALTADAFPKAIEGRSPRDPYHKTARYASVYKSHDFLTLDEVLQILATDQDTVPGDVRLLRLIARSLTVVAKEMEGRHKTSITSLGTLMKTLASPIEKVNRIDPI